MSIKFSLRRTLVQLQDCAANRTPCVHSAIDLKFNHITLPLKQDTFHCRTSFCGFRVTDATKQQTARG